MYGQHQYHGSSTHNDSENDKDNSHENDNDSLWNDNDDNPVAALRYRLEASRSSYPSSLSSSSSSSSDRDNDEEHSIRYHSHEHIGNRDEEEDDNDNNNDNDNDKDKDNQEDGKSCVSSSTSSSVPSDDTSSTISVQSVVEKIEDFILQTVIEPLSQEPNPSIPEINVKVDAIDFKRKLSLHHLTQARSLTSIIKVAAFCYDLLAPATVAVMDESDKGNGNDTMCTEEEGVKDTDGGNYGEPQYLRPSQHRHRVQQRTRKTTTTREVYYFYVTYFRDQRECDKAIWDLVCILELPSRQSLGLVASPKGWFCGSIDVYNAHSGELKFNGRELDPHGMAITPSTYDNSSPSNYNYNYNHKGNCSNDRSADSNNDVSNNSIINNSIRINSDAKCILVIEKEGVYTRLSEDKFFLKYFPCILVTGKGFPDIATRRWVKRMQKALKIPVYGLCDCNPFGVSVLDSYRHDQGVRLKRKSNYSNKNKNHKHKHENGDTENESSDDPPDELHWIGLCPSQVETMDLPPQVFQKLTGNDKKRLQSLLVSKTPTSKSFAERGGRYKAERIRELKAMYNYKVELEALHWKGSDYLCHFVHHAIVSEYERFQKQIRPK
uniref:DNA topoisomerase (ATP-hydrolyzing) n=1 Tax=Pseudo-nitzschia australis TaxID=44445 RepID=A0A7S4ASE7_9STRA